MSYLIRCSKCRHSDRYAVREKSVICRECENDIIMPKAETNTENREENIIK